MAAAFEPAFARADPLADLLGVVLEILVELLSVDDELREVFVEIGHPGFHPWIAAGDLEVLAGLGDGGCSFGLVDLCAFLVLQAGRVQGGVAASFEGVQRRVAAPAERFEVGQFFLADPLVGLVVKLNVGVFAEDTGLREVLGGLVLGAFACPVR